MNVLLLGGSGLLGTALREAAPRSATLFVPTRATLDATDARAVQRALAEYKPEVVICCAALHDAAAAEADPEAATALHVTAVRDLAQAAAARKARVILPSTYEVFDGESRSPWREVDRPNPQTVYARSKREGERQLLMSGARALVVRSGWLYGRAGRNFVQDMYERAKGGMPARVVDDQWGAPTSADALARWMWALIAREATGIVHATAQGETTPADVARRIYAHFGFADGVHPMHTAELPAALPHPRYGVLDCSWFDALVPGARRPWDEVLVEHLRALG